MATLMRPIPTVPLHLNGTGPADPQHDLVAQVVLIRPEMADAMLANPMHNRPINKSRIRTMIGDLRAGNWQLNGEPIICDDQGRVLDGQHRLHAVRESGVALRTLLVLGVAPTTMTSIDQGAPRSLADTVTVGGLRQGREVAATGRWIWRLEHDSMRRVATDLRNPDLAAFLKTHAGLPAALSWGASLRGLLPSSLASALFYACGAKDAPLAKTMFTKLSKGANLSQADLGFQLREKWLRDRTRLTHLGMVSRAASLVLAWNAARQGVTRVNVHWKGQDDGAVGFPRID